VVEADRPRRPLLRDGRIIRAEHETCLVAKRGRVDVLDRSIRSTFCAPDGIFEAKVGEHSEKPEFFYKEIVEKLTPGPYVELFARRKRPGWTCLGDQVDEAEPTLFDGSCE
jgi:N6-adenosine-specific RNA methylase IME4